jgi:hypothetical protein
VVASSLFGTQALTCPSSAVSVYIDSLLTDKAGGTLWLALSSSLAITAHSESPPIERLC